MPLLQGDILLESTNHSEVNIGPDPIVFIAQGNDIVYQNYKIETEAIPFDTDYYSSDSYYNDEEVVTSSGSEGEKLVYTRINGVKLKEVITKQPEPKTIAKGTKPAWTTKNRTYYADKNYSWTTRTDKRRTGEKYCMISFGDGTHQWDVGTYLVKTPGEKGTRRVTVRDHYYHGKLDHTESISSTITKEPVNGVRIYCEW